MEYKITVNTPKKQAAVCMKTQKKAFLGLNGAKKITAEVLVNDEQFYWIVDIEEKELPKLIKNTARGEVIIRKFYKMLFKTIDRCNTLQKKWAKGAIWIKKQMVKRIRKLTEGSPDDNSSLLNSIEGMSNDELGEFIKVNDREAMNKLLSGELIKVEENGELQE